MVYKAVWTEVEEVGSFEMDLKKPPLEDLVLPHDNVVLVDSEKWTWEIPIDKMVA